MFENLREFLSGNEGLKIDRQGQLNQREVVVATVFLLASIAHSDHDFEAAELNSIVTQMFREFDLPEHETGEIVEVVDFLIRDGSKIESFIEIVRKHLDSEQKQVVLAMVWKLLNADGTAERQEAELAADLRAKLGLSLEQAVRARQMAEVNQQAIAQAKAAEEEEE